MPRLRQVPKSDVANDTIANMYESMFGDRDPVAEPGTPTGTPGDFWTVFALVPDVFKHALRGFAMYRHPRRLLDPQLRQLGQIRTGWVLECQFVFSQHCKSCRALGMPEEKISAIPSWQVSDVFSPAERAVLAYTDALALGHGRVSDVLFETLASHLSDEEILELTYITSMYIMEAIIARALRLEFDDIEERVVEVPGDHESLALPGYEPKASQATT